MLRRAHRALIALSCVALCGSFSLAEDGADDAHASRRLARGRLDLPGPGLPGDLSGLLFRNGRPTFELDALLLRDEPGGPDGHIVGVARRLHGPNAGAILPLRGAWEQGAAGHGGFRAVILEPAEAEPEADGAGEAVIVIRGRFHDPNGPFLPDGAFRGRWHRTASEDCERPEPR